MSKCRASCIEANERKRSRLSCRWLTACVQKGAKMSVQKLLRVEAYLALNEWELIKWELISAEKRKRKRRQRETVLVSRPLRSLYQEINTICSNKGQFSRTCWHRLSAETLWFSSRPPRIDHFRKFRLESQLVFTEEWKDGYLCCQRSESNNPKPVVCSLSIITPFAFQRRGWFLSCQHGRDRRAE